MESCKSLGTQPCPQPHPLQNVTGCWTVFLDSLAAAVRCRTRLCVCRRQLGTTCKATREAQSWCWNIRYGGFFNVASKGSGAKRP